MTVGVLEAELLGRSIDRLGLGDRLPATFYREAAKIIGVPWRMATGADFAYRQTVGKRPFGINLLNAYVRRVVLAAHVRADVNDLMIRVSHLLTPLSALLRPGTIARVLVAARKSPVAR